MINFEFASEYWVPLRWLVRRCGPKCDYYGLGREDVLSPDTCRGCVTGFEFSISVGKVPDKSLNNSNAAKNATVEEGRSTEAVRRHQGNGMTTAGCV